MAARFYERLKVADASDLNPYLGQPWYEAAREVCVTMKQRIAGTFHESSVIRGTRLEEREFATEFRDFLRKVKITRRVAKSRNNDGYILKVTKDARSIVTAFADHGDMHDSIKPFFQAFLSDAGEETRSGIA